MRKAIDPRDLAKLPPKLRASLLPLDKLALGAGCGVTVGLGIFLVTAYHLLLSDWLVENVAVLQGRTFSGDGLWLLEQYFKGYAPDTWSGALVGALWGLWVGFVFGWFAAFLRNLTLATWLIFVRARQRLASQRDFLDQI